MRCEWATRHRTPLSPKPGITTQDGSARPRLQAALGTQV